MTQDHKDLCAYQNFISISMKYENDGRWGRFEFIYRCSTRNIRTSSVLLFVLVLNQYLYELVANLAVNMAFHSIFTEFLLCECIRLWTKITRTWENRAFKATSSNWSHNVVAEYTIWHWTLRTPDLHLESELKLWELNRSSKIDTPKTKDDWNWNP